MRKLFFYLAILTVFSIVIVCFLWPSTDTPQIGERLVALVNRSQAKSTPDAVDLHQVKVCGINSTSSTEFHLEIEGERFVTEPSVAFKRWQWAALSKGEIEPEPFRKS